MPLVQQELVKACMALPIAFLEQGEHFVPVAVQGFAPGRNMCVAPDGRWMGAYIPAAYRGYPFALLPNEQGQWVLCMNADSGLISDSEGEALFDAEGNTSQAVKDVLRFLEQVAQNRQTTQVICDVLAQQQLLEPWQIKVKTGEGEQSITGLFRINESALNQLDAAALKTLQQTGALQLAYMQLLSMQHMSKLAELAKANAQYAQQQATKLQADKNGNLDLEFLNQNGTLNLSGL